MRRALLLAALAAGCAAVEGAHPAPPPRDPEPVVEPPALPLLVAVEDDFRDVGMALEMGGRHGEALAHYAVALAPGADVTPRLRAIAHLRTAACLLHAGEPARAREHLGAVLREPAIAADDDIPPPLGGAAASLRLDAEARFRDAEGDPVAVYGALLREAPAAAAVAVVALARLGGPEARALVARLAADPDAPATLRATAAAELAHWGARVR
jgi:hypothetical protein